MRVFAERDLREFLGSALNGLSTDVEREGEDKLLNVNEGELIEYLVAKYALEPIEIYTDRSEASEREDHVRAGSRAFDYGIDRGDMIKTQVFTYHVPFAGPSALLEMQPSSRIVWSIEIELDGDELQFDLPNYHGIEQVQREANRILENLKRQADSVNGEVTQHNASLRDYATKKVRTRKESILQRRKQLSSLGVPMRRKGAGAVTLRVPVAKRKLKVEKPKASDAKFTPEWTLEDADYNEILRICFETCREIERHPTLYQGKEEEALRDYLLMALASHYENTTGETFNKQGKTDILVRHEGANAFVAECKFWSGQKGYFEAIDQLLSYLTWRDSKTALLMFVRNKQLDPVLAIVAEKTNEHLHFASADGRVAEGHFVFRFKLPKDDTRRATITVLCFHFPE
jgi:hypothetical protein